MLRNFCLIGLPHSGKSSLGKRACRGKGMGFIDTDNLIQNKYKKPLIEIINEKGQKKFLKIENEIYNSLSCSNTIISTGGSIIYNDNSINHIKNTLNSPIIHLHLSFDEFKKRFTDIETRGIINPNNLNLETHLEYFYRERILMYNSVADKLILADNKEKALKNLIKLDILDF